MPALPTTGTPAAFQNHVIVCGDGPLAHRIAHELTGYHGERVIVILPNRTKNHGPQITALPGVTVQEAAELSSAAFAAAGTATARALALVGADDIGNFHAALRAQELNPGLRLVVAVFNRRLGDHIRTFFRDCTVLSSSGMAAPSFVAAALGEPSPSHVRVSGRTLYVTRRAEAPDSTVVCGLGVPEHGGTTTLIPPDELHPGFDGLVLAVADGTPRNPLARRIQVREHVGVLRGLAANKYSVLAAVLLAVAVAGYCLLLAAGHQVGDALYLTIMDLTGSALTSVSLGGPEKVSQVLLTADGVALIPLVTAVILGAQVRGVIRNLLRPRGGHVIVIGLGDVGTRVIGELHDLGYAVACVDHDPAARGIALARRLGLPVVIGEAQAEETLRQAGLADAAALLSATSSDIVNLEAALQARAVREDMRIVLRLFDDDLAERVQKTVGNVLSRSVSYLAAPAFALALLEHQVLRTIPVGRHVLLIADVRVEPGSAIAGRTPAELERDRLTRVLAVERRYEPRFDWAPRRDRTLSAGDRVIVLATRAGLGGLLAGNRPG